MSVDSSRRQPTPAPRRLKLLAREVAATCVRLASTTVPKSYRFTVGVPMVEAANALADLVERAERCVPTSPLMAHERKLCYSRALAKAATIGRLCDLCVDLNIARASSFEALTERLLEIREITKSLKRGVRVRGTSSAEDLLAWYRAQAEAMESVADELMTREAKEVRDHYRGRAQALAAFLGRDDNGNVTP